MTYTSIDNLTSLGSYASLLLIFDYFFLIVVWEKEKTNA